MGFSIWSGCKQCSGGFTAQKKVCDCVRKNIWYWYATRHSGTIQRYINADFELIGDADKQIIDSCINDGQSYIFLGTQGTGKTYLASLILRSYYDNQKIGKKILRSALSICSCGGENPEYGCCYGTGYVRLPPKIDPEWTRLVYVEANDMYDKIKQGFNDGENYTNKIRDADLLILDEYTFLYSDHLSDFARSEISRLIDYRYDYELQTIYITNWTQTQIESCNLRTFSRLQQDCKLVRFGDVDFRVSNKGE